MPGIIEEPGSFTGNIISPFPLLGPEERFLADRAIVDSYFMDGTPEQIIKNSVCDACAQATEGYDSKLGNDLTKTLCKQAFDVLYDAIMNDKPENYPYGSMLSGMGFGNCSTTLGHASYLARCIKYFDFLNIENNVFGSNWPV